MKHLTLFINVIILLSCASSQDIASTATNTTDMTTNEIISGTYTLEKLENTNVTDKKLTIKFNSETNQVSGFAGCNGFSGTYSIKDNTLSFSELVATKMFCQNEANTIERKMFQNLAKVNAFELSNGILSLKNDKGILIIANKNMGTKSRQDETNINIKYFASTRGFFETIWIEDHVLIHTNDRDLKEVSSYKLSDEQFSEILAIYKNIDVKSLSSLEPPSKTFQYDAAPMARLSIVKNGTTYITTSFDHGNPPKSILKFVEKVLSIKEIVVKQ